MFHGVDIVEGVATGVQFAAKGLDDRERVRARADGDGHEAGEQAQQLIGCLVEAAIDLVAELRLVIGDESPIADVADDAASKQGEKMSTSGSETRKDS